MLLMDACTILLDNNEALLSFLVQFPELQIKDVLVWWFNTLDTSDSLTTSPSNVQRSTDFTDFIYYDITPLTTRVIKRNMDILP